MLFISKDSDLATPNKPPKHPRCMGYYDGWNGDYDCEYQTTINCEDCKYGLGKKDPEAKCNQLKR